MYSCSADSGVDAARFQRLLQFAEIVEGAADHQLRFALVAGALAHLLETVVDEIELQLILVLDTLRDSVETRPFS